MLPPFHYIAGNHIDSPDKNSNQQIYGISLVLMGALAIGIMPSAAKIAYQEGANPLSAIMLRNLIGVIGIGGYMLIRRIRFDIGWQAFRFSSLTGVTQSFSSVGIMGSVAYIDVSLAVLIIFCFPFWVTIYNHYSGQSRLTPMVLVCFFIALLGLSLALGTRFTSLDPVGLWLAGLGMVSMATMVLIVSHNVARIGAIPANFYMTGWTSVYFLVIAAVAPPLGILEPASFPESSRGWIAIFGTGVSFTLGYVFFFVGAAIIGTTRASILSISEPVMIILVAVMLVDEWLSPVQWLGIMLVIGSLAILEFPKKSAPEDIAQ
jgi:drug/metabolite transporter (DMT)-like permease